MATDYAKKKNDELAALCKERGLAHTGKKADLVKRLEEDDSKGGVKPVIEDEIDWDDEPAAETAKAATTTAAASAVAAGGVGEVSNPQAVPNQTAAIDPAQTNDLSVDPPADAPEEKAEEKDYTSGIANRTLDEEIEKRKARARKFGMPEDSEEIKALERAQRFGTTELPGMLNQALPTAKERKRGRDGDDGGIRKRSRGPQGRRGGRQGAGRPQQENGGAPASKSSWMSDKDREAMERRKARFAAAS